MMPAMFAILSRVPWDLIHQLQELKRWFSFLTVTDQDMLSHCLDSKPDLENADCRHRFALIDWVRNTIGPTALDHDKSLYPL